MRRSRVSSLIAVAAALVTGCSSPSSPSTAGDCQSDVVYGEMPEWARTGFSAGARVPHVLGRDQRIVAAYFTDALVAAPGPDPVNKVLFVPRDPLGAPTILSIDAQLDGSGPIVHRERVDGPGPGTLDMPVPGCWRMTLRWADQTDTIDLEYGAPSGATSPPAP